VFYPTRFKGLSEKLLTQFHGPFTITKCYSNGLNYEVEGIRNGKKFVVDCVHISRLKPYHDREQLISRLEKLTLESNDSTTETDEPTNATEIALDSSDTEIYYEDSATEVYKYESSETEVNSDEKEVVETQGTQTLCEIETPVAEPIPRRSERLRMKRNNYAFLSYFIILCLCENVS
jgi:hypothetical protein